MFPSVPHLAPERRHCPQGASTQAASAPLAPRLVETRRGCSTPNLGWETLREPDRCWLDQGSPVEQGWEGREKSSLKAFAASGFLNKNTRVCRAGAGVGRMDETMLTKY